MELAGALAELARTGLDQEYRAIDRAATRVILVQSAPRVLPAFSQFSRLTPNGRCENSGSRSIPTPRSRTSTTRAWRSTAAALLPARRSGQPG